MIVMQSCSFSRLWLPALNISLSSCLLWIIALSSQAIIGIGPNKVVT